MDLLYSLQCDEIKRTFVSFCVKKRLKVSDGILIPWKSVAGYVKQENISYNDLVFDDHHINDKKSNKEIPLQSLRCTP